MVKTKLFSALTAILLTSFSPIGAQNRKNVTVTGTVMETKNMTPVARVQIAVEGTTLGTVSDADGNYVIKNIPLAKCRITASAMGYARQTYEIDASAGARQHLDIYLDEQAIPLDGLVVTGSRSETLRRIAPTLVTVLNPEIFTRTASATLSQGLRFQPGLRVEDNCQNCGFNQVRINGLEGAYSQILIDGRPVFSALAGVYGLEQIPANMIDRVEVVRGGGSALYGSGAVGGVINIITREPLRNSGEVTHQTGCIGNNRGGFSSVEHNTLFNASVVTDNRRAGITLFGAHNYRPGHDYDADGFTELPILRNRSFGFNTYLKTGLYGKLSAEYHSMQEYRRGGDRLDLPPFQARIAEYLQHYITGGSLKFDQGFADGRNRFSLYASMQHVHRRSYYGGGDLIDNLLDPLVHADSDDDRRQAAGEIIPSLTSYGVTSDLSGQFGGLYTHIFGNSWHLTAGIENTNELLKDKSGYRPENIRQRSSVLSQFDQLEYKTDRFSGLIGVRMDMTNLYQGNKRQIDPLLIFSPRANLRYTPVKDLALRLSYSEGFRAPQFFDEEMHVELLGGVPVVRVLGKNLKEERSRSLSASTDYYGSYADWQYNLMIEGFATFISDKFETAPPKVVDGHEIRTIENQRQGISKVYGFNAEARIAYRSLWDLQLGLTLQQSRYGDTHVLVEADEESRQREISTRKYERTPSIYGYFVSTIRPWRKLSINLSGTLTGAMDVLHNAYEGVTASADGSYALIDGERAGALKPDGSFAFTRNGQLYRGVAEGYARLSRSKAFMELDLRLAYEFKISKTLGLEINGGAHNLFNSYQDDGDCGPGRASDYVYGPMQPRRLFLGARLTF